MDHLGRIILVVVISTLLGSTPLRSQAQLMLGLRIGSFSAATHFGPRFTYCDSLPLWFQGSLTISDHGAYSTMHDYHDPLLRCNPFRYHHPVFKIHTWWRPGSYYQPHVYVTYYPNTWASYWGYHSWGYYWDAHYAAQMPFVHLPRHPHASPRLGLTTHNPQRNRATYKETPRNRSPRAAVRRAISRGSPPPSLGRGSNSTASATGHQKPSSPGKHPRRRAALESTDLSSRAPSTSTKRSAPTQARTFPTRSPQSLEIKAHRRRQPRAAPRSNPRAAPRSSPRAQRTRD